MNNIDKIKMIYGNNIKIINDNAVLVNNEKLIYGTNTLSIGGYKI